jgi:uncharacterized protein YegL
MITTGAAKRQLLYFTYGHKAEKNKILNELSEKVVYFSHYLENTH